MDFSERRLLKDGFWLVEFGAERCAPCRAMKPILEALPTSFGGKLAIAELDADDHFEIADRFSVRSLPTLLLFHQGELIDQRVGGLSRTALEAWISDKL